MKSGICYLVSSMQAWTSAKDSRALSGRVWWERNLSGIVNTNGWGQVSKHLTEPQERPKKQLVDESPWMNPAPLRLKKDNRDPTHTKNKGEARLVRRTASKHHDKPLPTVPSCQCLTEVQTQHRVGSWPLPHLCPPSFTHNHQFHMQPEPQSQGILAQRL